MKLGPNEMIDSIAAAEAIEADGSPKIRAPSSSNGVLDMSLLRKEYPASDALASQVSSLINQDDIKKLLLLQTEMYQLFWSF
jgi:hypothetical protein